MVHEDELEATGDRVAARLAGMPPKAVRLTKRLMREPDAPRVHETMQTELTEFAHRLGTPEAQEAIQAFLERRPPDFSKFT